MSGSVWDSAQSIASNQSFVKGDGAKTVCNSSHITTISRAPFSVAVHHLTQPYISTGHALSGLRNRRERLPGHRRGLNYRYWRRIILLASSCHARVFGDPFSN